MSPADFRCVLDKKLSPTTIKKFAAEIGDVWGDACGRNRGIFVLDPPDGKTYGESQSTIHIADFLCVSQKVLDLVYWRYLRRGHWCLLSLQTVAACQRPGARLMWGPSSHQMGKRPTSTFGIQHLVDHTDNPASLTEAYIVCRCTTSSVVGVRHV